MEVYERFAMGCRSAGGVFGNRGAPGTFPCFVKQYPDKHPVGSHLFSYWRIHQLEVWQAYLYIDIGQK